MADVDKTLPGADGIGADGHALDDGVGIALHHRPVQKGAGIALGAVADEKLRIARSFPAEAPFAAGGEAAAAPAPQAGLIHRLQNRL